MTPAAVAVLGRVSRAARPEPMASQMNAGEFQERLSTARATARRRGLRRSSPIGSRSTYRLLSTWNQKINLTGLNLEEPTPEALDRLLIEPLVAAAVRRLAPRA